MSNLFEYSVTVSTLYCWPYLGLLSIFDKRRAPRFFHFFPVIAFSLLFPPLASFVCPSTIPWQNTLPPSRMRSFGSIVLAYVATLSARSLVVSKSAVANRSSSVGTPVGRAPLSLWWGSGDPAEGTYWRQTKSNVTSSDPSRRETKSTRRCTIRNWRNPWNPPWHILCPWEPSNGEPKRDWDAKPNPP